MAVADSAGMEHIGTIGVRIGEAGRITRVPFRRDDADGRVILNSAAWRALHESYDQLTLGRAILITMRESDSCRVRHDDGYQLPQLDQCNLASSNSSLPL